VADDEARMTFTNHLAELRVRLIRSGVALAVGFIVCYILSDQLFELIRRPLAALEAAAQAGGDRQAKWVVLNPIEPVLVKLRLAAFGGLLLMSPYIIYQICAFIFPGLTAKEKNVVRVLLGGCGAFAIAGVGIAYFAIMPLVVPYLLEWTPEGVVNQLRMSETISFIVKVLTAFAVAFQFPMVVLVLVHMELLTPETLKRYRRIAIVGMALGAAMLTPPDPGSMVMMLLPLVLLYEGSIWMSYLVVLRKRKRAGADGGQAEANDSKALVAKSDTKKPPGPEEPSDGRDKRRDEIDKG